MARAGPPVIVLAHSYWIAMRSVSHATLIDPIRAFEPLTTRWFSTLYHNNLLFEKENDLVIGFSLFVLHYFVCNGFFYYVLSLITCSNPIVFFFSFFLVCCLSLTKYVTEEEKMYFINGQSWCMYTINRNNLGANPSDWSAEMMQRNVRVFRTETEHHCIWCTHISRTIYRSPLFVLSFALEWFWLEQK